MNAGLHASKGRIFVPAILACALWVAGIAHAQAPPDDDIARAVRESLSADEAVGTVPIEVASHEGVVLLAGVVNNLLAKRWAEERALAVRGVRSVVNLVDVVPSKAKTDAMLREDVMEAIALDGAVRHADITVTVDNQTVILMGRAESWQERQLLERVVAGVSGVRDVENRVQVEVGPARSDAEIRQEVMRALQWDAYVDEAPIEVKVDRGAVRLTGNVSHAIERQYAMQAAWVAGVQSVDVSELRIDPALSGDPMRLQRNANKPDPEIKAALDDALRYDPRVKMFRIGIDVSNGIVALTGAVDNIRAKRAAEQDARNTVGVAFVNNHIVVQPGRVRSDPEIRRDVVGALGRRAYVDGADIQVSVQNGAVTLAGTVESYWEKAQADDAVAGINGVVEIRNYLRVERGS